MKKALTIAGIDSGGGAGVLADVKTFASFGVYGMAAVTAVTAQNTMEIRGIHALPPSMVEKQIRAAIDDIGVDAAKTGMLFDASIVRSVAKALRGHEFPLVVDPVMISKSGTRLLKENAIEALKKYIFGIATIITPNKDEAEVLAGFEINGMEDAIKAAEMIAKEGIEYVLIKGGHLREKKAIDILYHNGKIKKYSKAWQQGCTHGVGCSFSAAITANLAKGKSVEDAIKIAEEYITIAIKHGARIGKGHCPVNHVAYMRIPYEKWNVYSTLKKAVDEIAKCKDFINFIPEVGTNFAYSLPKEFVDGIAAIAAVNGRIVKGKNVILKGEIEFGASRHLAKALMKAMEYDENVRAVMNIKYDEKIIRTAKKHFAVSYYDRREEPEKIKSKEGATVPWGVETAIKKAGKMPDLIYHKGDIGKEAMILIFGKNPIDVLKKFYKLKDSL